MKRKPTSARSSKALRRNAKPAKRFVGTLSGQLDGTRRQARGHVGLGQLFRHQSRIGSCFTGRVEATTKLKSGLDAVLPSVEGRAWITGRADHYVDDSQPYAHGFSLQEYVN
ncbi:proline racemase family protein [Paraburkholderia sp. BL6665CI2N2]|uniref:proline racemase family protein n=1 Tax=Paraburkholderia sp. BL6665CI2N2 TaxID=1938806 RepID=UPI0010652E14|nr:proline racemase family protein [Paraburkholderia sp. BL6665CI2N2]